MFAHPIYLLALIIPFVLVIYTWRTHTRALPLPFDHKYISNTKWVSITLNIVNTIPALILATAIFILAGPRTFEQPRAKRELTNIQFCLDVSGSMATNFGENDRYHVAMDSLNQFLTYRKGDAFSLLIFGGDNLRWIPLTTDPSSFSYATPFLHPNKLPAWFNGGTSIGKALKQSERFLQTTDKGEKIILLISDGASNDLFDGADQRIATSLKENNITLYAIHIGDSQLPEQVALIANFTGGKTFTAGDPNALKSIFEKIDSIQKASFTRLAPDPVDNFKPYSITALCLIIILTLSLYKLRYTPF